MSATRALRPPSPPPTARGGSGLAVRLALLLLGLSGAVVGFWALFAPVSFYSSFPGFGYSWVADAGPYDEHLVRDVGALYLALLAVTLVALLRPAAVRAWVAGLAWLVFGVPHLVFHAAHAGRGDVVEVTALAVSVLLAAVACLPAGRRPLNMP